MKQLTLDWYSIEEKLPERIVEVIGMNDFGACFICWLTDREDNRWQFLDTWELCVFDYIKYWAYAPGKNDIIEENV